MSLNSLDSFKDALNELSLALVTADDTSLAQNSEELKKALGIIEASLGGDKASQRISLSLRFIREKFTAEHVSNFVSGSLALLNGDEAELPGEGSSLTSDAPDLLSEIEPEFLVEFIEKHTGMMEEFDAAIMELCRELDSGALSAEEQEEKRKNFDRYAKGYIHNVKGDAGSIGLLGIERVCHFIEDYIVQNGASQMSEALLVFKEWVVVCMKALSEGEIPEEKGIAFQNRFVDILNGTAKIDEPQSDDAGRKAMESQLGESLGVEANLDLLAELMSEMNPPGDLTSGPVSEAPAQAASVVEEAAPEPVLSQESETYALSGEPEVFIEFIVEAQDHLTHIESTLLESGGTVSKDAIDSIFRGIHSIKGASSYFTLRDTTETSHLTETVLDEVRDGKRSFDQTLIEFVLEYVSIQQILFGQARSAAANGQQMHRYPQARDYLDRLQAYYKGEKAVKREVPVAKPKSSAVAVATPTAPVEENKAQKNNEKLDVKNFVKVDTLRLDQLIESIGEMCIYSSMLVKKCRELLGHDEGIIQTTHQVSKFSRDLQDIGMSMRLIPIRGLFQKMSRLVWDTSKKIKKEIKFVMHGEDTELDRTIIDKLADPLMHMIRNALDHGVEPPDEREQNGKSRSGTITLSAQHSSGAIQVIIQDDGRGLNPEKLIKKAIEKGVIREDQKLSKEEAFQLIFAAGFSTAAQVTDISGRGVGMDVVKRNIESLRGRVNIQSEVGKGTTFTIELPLTLAVLDGIEVKVGQDSFIIPTLSVIEFIKPQNKHIHTTFDKGETFEFRGRYLPVFRLSDTFEVQNAATNPEEALFIIVESVGEQAAIMVDSIVGTHSTVIKSLGDMFEQGRGLSGCAIMSSGEVSLILDIRSLLVMARSKETVSAIAAKGSAREKEVTHV